MNLCWRLTLATLPLALACDPEPAPANIIFVTSTVHDGNLGGLAGADAICNERAAAAGLPGTYVAWLSTAEVDAMDRVAGARGWVRPDGRPFADNIENLVGRNWYPPALDEFGELVPDDTRTLTGTDYTGHFFALFGSCQDWSSNEPPSINNSGVGSGVPHEGITGWSSGGSGVCGASYRLQCLGVDHNLFLHPTPAKGRLAFISKSTVLTGGLAAADAQCQAEAEANDIPGTFRALLATSSASAASRFDLEGPTWVRLDGIALFASAADLPAGRPLAPFTELANNALCVSLTRLGAPTPGSPSDGSCDDWTSTVGETKGGRSSRIDALAYGGMIHPCAEPKAHYCFEE